MENEKELATKELFKQREILKRVYKDLHNQRKTNSIVVKFDPDYYLKIREAIELIDTMFTNIGAIN